MYIEWENRFYWKSLTDTRFLVCIQAVTNLTGAVMSSYVIITKMHATSIIRFTFIYIWNKTTLIDFSKTKINVNWARGLSHVQVDRLSRLAIPHALTSKLDKVFLSFKELDASSLHSGEESLYDLTSICSKYIRVRLLMILTNKIK